MITYPELELSEVTLDPDLVRQVPYDLSLYYLALPLAQENGQVSVVMAHPENTTARKTLSRLLHADVVPLRARSESIRAALEQVHGQPKRLPREVLAWNDSAGAAEAVQRHATAFAAVLNTQVIALSAAFCRLETALAQARRNRSPLAVVSQPAGRPAGDLLRHATTPVLLVRGTHRPLRQLLLATRGYASDDQALNWILPLVVRNGARVTLMPLQSTPVLELEGLLCTDGPAKRHMDHLLKRLNGHGSCASLRVRPGNPVDQVVDELGTFGYDLLVVAAEAHGEFVAQVLGAMDRRAAHGDRPVLVLKPQGLPTTS